MADPRKIVTRSRDTKRHQTPTNVTALTVQGQSKLTLSLGPGLPPSPASGAGAPEEVCLPDRRSEARHSDGGEDGGSSGPDVSPAQWHLAGPQRQTGQWRTAGPFPGRFNSYVFFFKFLEVYGS